MELGIRGIPHARQVPVSVSYKRFRVGELRLDLLIQDQLVVELKSADSLAPVHMAQLLSYLKVTGFRLGLLINFNVMELRHGIKRIIHTPELPPSQNPPISL